MSEQSDAPRHRRAVFLQGLKRLLDPVADYVESRLDLQASTARKVIRPPGAIPENQFLDTCYRCGNCVDVCPPRAIRPISNGDPAQTGTPYIDPDLGACTVCDELACMRACPSGALRLVSDVKGIAMGTAQVDHALCLRSGGENCRICLEKCPFGVEVIRLGSAGDVFIDPMTCIGCGLCRLLCPATPKAIRTHAR